MSDVLNGRIGRRIQELRKAAGTNGITQEELGRGVGTSRGQVSRWEVGDSTPRRKSMEALCDFFGVTQKNLYGYDVDPGSERQVLADLFRIVAELQGSQNKLQREVAVLKQAVAGLSQ